MLWLKRTVLSLLLLLLVGIIAGYFILQTQWAAKQLSQLISRYTPYPISMATIQHNWRLPNQWTLHQVDYHFASSQLKANNITLVVGLNALSWHQPWRLAKLIVSDGQLSITDQHLTDIGLFLPIASQVLQLKNIDITYQGKHGKLYASNVDAGITPWQSQQPLLNTHRQFQLSAQTVRYQGLQINNLLIEGQQQPQGWQISNLGANLNQGQLTAHLSKQVGQGWHVQQVALNNLHWQTTHPLSQLLGTLKQLPIEQIDRANLINLQLQGPNWAANDVNISLKQWHKLNTATVGYTGEIVINANRFTHNSQQFTNPALQASLLSNGIDFHSLSSNWQNGIIKAAGNWQSALHALTLSELSATGISYNLPANSWHHWQHRLPAWLQQLTINQFTSSNVSLAAPQAAFPWQFTALNGQGQDLLLVQQHQLGLWQGSININASQATVNQIDLQQPSFTVSGDAQTMRLQPLSALYSPGGLLRGALTIDQHAGYPFRLVLAGQNSDYQALSHWGWSDSLTQQGSGDFHLNLQGELDANSVVDSLQGQLELNNAQGDTQQRLQAGQAVTVSAVTKPAIPHNRAVMPAKPSQPNPPASNRPVAQPAPHHSSKPSQPTAPAASNNNGQPHHYNPLADTLAEMLSQPKTDPHAVIPPITPNN